MSNSIDHADVRTKAELIARLSMVNDLLALAIVDAIDLSKSSLSTLSMKTLSDKDAKEMLLYLSKIDDNVLAISKKLVTLSTCLTKFSRG